MAQLPAARARKAFRSRSPGPARTGPVRCGSPRHRERRAGLPAGSRERDEVDAECSERRRRWRWPSLEPTKAVVGARPLALARRATSRERYSDWAASYRERLIDRYTAVLAALVDFTRTPGDTSTPSDRSRAGRPRPLNGAATGADHRLRAIWPHRLRPAALPGVPPGAGRAAGRRAGGGHLASAGASPRRRARLVPVR